MFGIKRDSDERFWNFWEYVAVAGLLFGFTSILIYSISSGKIAQTFGILSMIAFAAWMGGSLLGFLFGVPRFQAGDSRAADGARVVPNTNLEQISDWLTKIIVGATLVQIRQIADSISSLSLAIGDYLDVTGAAVVAGAEILFFSFAGFMWGYLWSSLRIFREIDKLARRASRVES